MRAPKSITVYIDETLCNEPPISKPRYKDNLWNDAEIGTYKAKVLEGIVDVP